MPEMLHSPLHERHVEAGAKFGEFGGWEMPLEYAGGGVLAEHHAVRDGVGIFDVSHLGKAVVRGHGAVDFLNLCLANDLHKIGPGQAQYTMLCNEQGGVTDDLIAYVKSEDEVFLIPNAANTTQVVQILSEMAEADRTANPLEPLEVVNQHTDHAVLAIQGPFSEQVLTTLGLPTTMDYMAFEVVRRDGWSMTVCRTGYTGEKGYELVVPTDHALEIWDEVMAAGQPHQIRPCGLGARDTLRTEMGYSLHGNDITPEINPVEAGLSWAVGWKKTEPFLGSEVLRELKAAGPARRMRGLEAVGRGIPRHGMEVVDAEGQAVGVVTSGTFSPTLKQGIGLALVDVRFQLGDEVGVQIRNRTEKFRLVKPPFVTPEVREG
ncbi:MULTISPECIES: glycine cleavage system aminomethyltransferase GcvT [unclassified Luteococcus]|uniref:glycine cleavage system aminomethyltransferase GcvT n=1 Tax=unclassified Luteococcus TaxID=2639923 RepID=UPI00313DCF8A